MQGQGGEYFQAQNNRVWCRYCFVGGSVEVETLHTKIVNYIDDSSKRASRASTSGSSPPPHPFLADDGRVTPPPLAPPSPLQGPRVPSPGRPTGADRRREPRLVFDSPIELWRRGNSGKASHAPALGLNLSAGGIRVITESCLRLHERVGIEVRAGLPARSGTVVWVKAQPDGCVAGIAFCC